MRPIARLVVSCALLALLTGCVDSTLRGSWGTWQFKQGGGPCSPAAAPETRTPSPGKGEARPPAPPPPPDVEPISATSDTSRPCEPAGGLLRPPSVCLLGVRWPPIQVCET